MTENPLRFDVFWFAADHMLEMLFDFLDDLRLQSVALAQCLFNELRGEPKMSRRVAGGILAGFKKAYLAIDVRVIDTKTSRILAATSVEGSATDIGGLVGLGSASVGLGAGLGGWSKTPLEKALRVCIQEAVNFIATKTPAQYYHYSETGTPVKVSTSQAPALTGTPASSSAKGISVYVTSSSVDTGDNCPSNSNPLQEDIHADGIGNVGDAATPISGPVTITSPSSFENLSIVSGGTLTADRSGDEEHGET